HSFGADGGSIAFLDTGAPSDRTEERRVGKLRIKQDGVTVLNVKLDPATGAYTVTEHAPIVHALGGDENNQDVTLNYQVTDRDGDTIDGTLAIRVNDDTPTIPEANAQVVVDDDDVTGANGNPGGTGDLDPANVTGTLAHSFGADGGSIAFLDTGAPSD